MQEEEVSEFDEQMTYISTARQRQTFPHDRHESAKIAFSPLAGLVCSKVERLMAGREGEKFVWRLIERKRKRFFTHSLIHSLRASKQCLWKRAASKSWRKVPLLCLQWWMPGFVSRMCKCKERSFARKQRTDEHNQTLSEPLLFIIQSRWLFKCGNF